MPTPRRPKNEELRPREFLTAQEVNKLVATAKKRGRYSARGAALSIDELTMRPVSVNCSPLAMLPLGVSMVRRRPVKTGT
jgi:hypothetical protein